MSTALRQKFIDHMTVRRLSQKTKESYTNAVAGLAAYYRKAPDTLSDEQIQAYLLYLIKERRLAWNSCNVVFSGLRCFYGEVLKWEQTRFSIPPRPRSKRLPMLLSVEEVQRLLDAARNPKHRTLLMTIYGAGLRVSEVVNLKPCHIESSRMMIRVEQGKGMKDRYTLLPKRLLHELRSYYTAYRPDEYLFFGKSKASPLPVGTAQKAYYHAKKRAGITQGRGIHTLRHFCHTPDGHGCRYLCDQTHDGAQRHQDHLRISAHQPAENRQRDQSVGSGCRRKPLPCSLLKTL
jgi:integrase/recombinase XerD